MGKSSKERQREYRQRLKDSGKKQLLVTIDSDVYDSLVNGAQGEGVTINELVNETLSGVAPERLPEPKEKEYQVTDADQFATIARSQLERIRKDDPKRLEALKKIKTWVDYEFLPKATRGTGGTDLPMRYAKMAIAQLESIALSEPGSHEALETVREWIRTHINASPEESFLQEYESFLGEVQKAYDNNFKDVSFSLACDKIGDLGIYLRETLPGVVGRQAATPQPQSKASGAQR